MVFFRDIGVGRHDLTPQNSPLFLEQAFALRLLGLNLTPSLISRNPALAGLDGHSGVALQDNLPAEGDDVHPVIPASIKEAVRLHPNLSDNRQERRT